MGEGSRKVQDQANLPRKREAKLNLSDPVQVKGQRDRGLWLKKRKVLGLFGEYMIEALDRKVEDQRRAR